MITELSAQNFKSWQDTGSLQFAPLTGFFWAEYALAKVVSCNSYFCSSRLWNVHRNGMSHFTSADDESLVDLRSFDDAIHRPIKGPSLGISVSWKLPKRCP